MRLEGKEIVILAAHDFEDVELLYPLIRLSEEGARITIATLPQDIHFSTHPYCPHKPITGRFGTTVPLCVFGEGKRWNQCLTDDLNEDNYDAVIIPGGFAPDWLRTNRKVLSFVAGMYKKGKVVAAICHGPQVLISTDAVEGTDLIRGEKCCSYEAIRDDLLNAGGKWVDAPAVRIGNVVTGRVPDDLPEFVHEIIEALIE